MGDVVGISLSSGGAVVWGEGCGGVGTLGGDGDGVSSTLGAGGTVGGGIGEGDDDVSVLVRELKMSDSCLRASVVFSLCDWGRRVLCLL